MNGEITQKKVILLKEGRNRVDYITSINKIPISFELVKMNLIDIRIQFKIFY